MNVWTNRAQLALLALGWALLMAAIAQSPTPDELSALKLPGSSAARAAIRAQDHQYLTVPCKCVPG
jgi:hypothetical protein